MELADLMAYKYGTRANPPQHRDSRRNKFNMQETVRKVGIRAITQQLCRSETQVRSSQMLSRHHQWSCCLHAGWMHGSYS